MKTFAAYNVAPQALLDALNAAGQPVLEIRYRGPERESVALACVCVGDSADDDTVKNIILGQSSATSALWNAQKHIAALAAGVGRSMQAFKG